MTAVKIDDRQNLVISGHERAVVYCPGNKQILAVFPSFPATDLRFALDWKRDCFVVAGWESPLTCFSAQTGERRWCTEEIFHMDRIAVHPTEPLAIISGASTKPHRGVLLCDLRTGEFVAASEPNRTIYRRLVHPSGAFVVDQLDDIRNEMCLWRCVGKDSDMFEFLGPEVPLSHVFSPKALLIAGLNRKLSLIDLGAKTCREDILGRSDPVLFGPTTYCRRDNRFRVVVRSDDVLKSEVLEVDADSAEIKPLCSINEDVTGVYFDDGERICCESGEIYDSATGELIETLDFDQLLSI